jgi:hypothetical protein
VLEERDQRRRDRDQLLRRDVLVVDLIALGGDELAVETSDDPVLLDAAVRVRLGVRLRDDVVLFLPRREIERVRLGVGGALLVPARLLVLLVELLLLCDLPELERRISRLRDLEVVEDAALLDPLVRRLDEPEVVDPRVTRKRRDEADVRSFRGLDRAHPAVVRRVHVPDLEPGALARQPARPEGREAPLVRDLGQRVRLVHELRELR